MISHKATVFKRGDQVCADSTVTAGNPRYCIGDPGSKATEVVVTPIVHMLPTINLVANDVIFLSQF